jgi:2-oxoglutarate ferredoxin oxidoreductase subunit alpha
VDGDGIPYRTVAGNRHPAAAYFTRGTGHDEQARYSEEPATWEALVGRLARKYATARDLVPKPEIRKIKGAEVGIIAYGSTLPAVDEARAQLKKEAGLKTSFLRLRALPCTPAVGKFIQEHERVYVVEANRDGQLRQILTTLLPGLAGRLRSASHTDGLPLTARWVTRAILSQEKE